MVWLKRGLLLAGVLAAVGAAGYATMAGGHDERHDAHALKLGKPTGPVPVKAFRVVPGGAREVRTLTGSVKARFEADVAFRVGGKVVSRLVELGDQVRRGQPLGRLDPQDLELALKAAEADRAAASAEAKLAALEEERFRRLAARSASSASEADTRRTAREAAAGRLDRAERAVSLASNNLAYATLSAEHDGLVTAVMFDVGQVVAMGQPVARIARSGGREAVVAVPEHILAEIRSAKAEVTLWAGDARPLPATLRELAPVADAMTRTYQARFSLGAEADAWPLGRTATVRLTRDGQASGLRLPATALFGDGAAASVWRIDDGKLVACPVQVMRHEEEAVVVAGGVKPGDLIVAAGAQKLDATIVVRPWEAK